MTPVAKAVTEVETFGVELRLDGSKVLMRFPAAEVREELRGRVAFLRAHRDEVSASCGKGPIPLSCHPACS